MLINHLETIRMGLSGVIVFVDEVSPVLTYIGTWSYLSNGIADPAKAGWKVQRIETTRIDRPRDTANTSYQEGSHIRNNRASLNRQP